VVGLKVNTEKAEFISHHHKAGQNYNTKMDIEYFGNIQIIWE
jgi:hypothetical protein